MKKFKVGIVSTLIVACTSFALTGCSLIGNPNPTEVSSTDGSGRVTNVYGKPWTNSITYGMVKDDTAHDEKNDWYLSVNYSYLKDTSLPEGKDSAGVSFDTEESASEKISQIISDESLSGHDGELIKGLYGLYTDWDSRGKEGISFMENMIDKISGIDSLEALSGFLSSEEAFDAGINLVGFDTDYDYEEPEYYSFVIVPTTLSLNDAAEYHSRTSYGDMLYDGISKQVSYVLERTGRSSGEAESILSGCMDFEKSVAAFEKTREFKSSAEYASSIKNKRTAEQIREESKAFPLYDIMKAFGLGDSERNYLLEPEWLAGMNDYYSQEHLEQMKDYLTVSVIQKYIGLSDKDSFLKMLESYGASTGDETGVTESYADNFIRNKLTVSLDKLYCEKYMTADIKSDVKGICDKLISSYKELISAGDRLSAEAKETALKKLDSIVVNAVYPEKFEDTSALSIRSVADGGTLTGAALDIENHNRHKMLEKKGKTRDLQLWEVDVTKPVVEYWTTQNSINVFAGIIDSGYYRYDMTKEEKYGGLGMLIAHELDHAIDAKGSLYDERGRNISWWSDDDMSRYADMKKRVADVYSGYRPFKNDTSYNGERVASEACAEIAGMQAVLKIADKDGFDTKELFRAYAAANRVLMTENSMQIAGLNFTYPLEFLKVNTTVKQFGEYMDATGAGEGDAMYTAPDDRIIIW